MRLYNDGPSSLTVSGNAVVDMEGSTGGDYKWISR